MRSPVLLSFARRAWSARVTQWVRIVLLGIVGGWLAVLLAGKVSQDVGPFSTTFSVRPALHGATDIELAPLGSLGLRTHDGPANLHVRVDRVDLAQAQALLADQGAVDSLSEDVERETRHGVIKLAVQSMIAATLGGALLGLVRRPHWSRVVVGGASGALFFAVIFGWSATTFRSNALVEPRYQGLLALAPQAIGNVQDVTEKFGVYRAQLEGVVQNVSRLYQTTDSQPTGDLGGDTVRILHVSDLHLNPAGFDLIDQLVTQFDADAVVDTGDINDWGTSFEGSFVNRIADVDAPYIFIRGNHDSAATAQAVAAQPNARVLDDNVTDIEGIRIWGVGDPRLTPDKSTDDSENQGEIARTFASVLATRLQAVNPKPDIVLTHDPATAADIGGAVPLVLAGHLHHFEERSEGTTRILVEGSTGGAGLRSVDSGTSTPLECSVLYINRTTHQLVAYDHIRVEGVGGSGASIDRHYVTAIDDEKSTTTSTSTSTTSTSTTSTSAVVSQSPTSP